MSRDKTCEDGRDKCDDEEIRKACPKTCNTCGEFGQYKSFEPDEDCCRDLPEHTACYKYQQSRSTLLELPSADEGARAASSSAVPRKSARVQPCCGDSGQAVAKVFWSYASK